MAMIGIVVQLILSWAIVWLYERNNLWVLGLTPSKKRAKQFVVFLLITSACCASGFLFQSYFGNSRWQLNPELNIGLIAEGAWWNLKSVLFEELIFRGVLFYIMMRKWGPRNAILISSAAFGIYHWFSYGVLGNVVQMVYVFFITGIMGMIYAFGYTRTMSLYIPIAIHFGWNFTNGFIFSKGPIGTGILKAVNDAPFRTDSYLAAFAVFMLPMLSTWLLNFYLIKREKQEKVNVYRLRTTQ